jgi:hypothetical protein
MLIVEVNEVGKVMSLICLHKMCCRNWSQGTLKKIKVLVFDFENVLN